MTRQERKERRIDANIEYLQAKVNLQRIRNVHRHGVFYRSECTNGIPVTRCYGIPSDWRR